MVHEEKAEEAPCQIRDCSCLVHPSCEGTKVELARLHAEVERLSSNPAWAEVDGLRHVVASLERERDEALAQVAVLLRDLDWQLLGGAPLGLQEGIKRDARALLTRLERAERVAEAVIRLWEECCDQTVDGVPWWEWLETALSAWQEAQRG